MLDALWIVLHGSWFMVHGSQPVVHNSWVMAHCSWLMANASWLMSRGSWLMAHALMAHGSWLMAHGSSCKCSFQDKQDGLHQRDDLEKRSTTSEPRCIAGPGQDAFKLNHGAPLTNSINDLGGTLRGHFAIAEDEIYFDPNKLLSEMDPDHKQVWAVGAKNAGAMHE